MKLSAGLSVSSVQSPEIKLCSYAASFSKIIFKEKFNLIDLR
jgi:hypothetical protein